MQKTDFFLKRLLSEEQTGQATAEYILMLSIMVALTVIVVKDMIGPAFSRMTQFVGDMIDKRFAGSNLHHFPVRR